MSDTEHTTLNITPAMMQRKEDERMAPPPPGTRQAGTLGDAPLNASDDYDETRAIDVYIVCVLQGDWPGSSAQVRERCPDLGAHYVRTLYEMVSRYAPSGVAWRFVCYTDRLSIEGVRVRSLPAGLWTYFAKLALFADGQFPEGARVLYFDLDTVLVGSWGPLISLSLDDRLVMLRDLWAERRPASGVMMWRAQASHNRIWSEFSHCQHHRPPYRHYHPRHTNPPLSIDGIRTDEEWLYHYTMPTDWRAWQEELPGLFASYKYHLLRMMNMRHIAIPPLTEEEFRALRVIYYHGRPRPHETVHKWNPFTRGLYDAK